MRNKFVSFASAVACCALLAACGGDDDATSGPTPTPTSTSSPTPTPTPAPTDFDFTKAFTSEATNTGYIFAYFAPTGGSETWNEGTRRNGVSGIEYAVSPESAAFTWPDETALTTFSAADLLTASPTLRTYRKGDNSLSLELPFAHVLRVSYETKVPFVRDAVAGNLRSLRYALFYNSVTLTTDITADLTYTGTAQVAGGIPGVTPSGAVSASPTTITVTASDKKVAGTIRIFENVGGMSVERAALPISATIGSGSTFGANIDDTVNGFKGTMVGVLAGPSREEILIIFNVENATDKREFIGSYIGG